jgi:hypothetical protein
VEPYEDSVYVVPASYFLEGIQVYTAILEAKTFAELEDTLPASCVNTVMEYVEQCRVEQIEEDECPRDMPYSPSDYRGLREYFDHQGHGLVEPVLAATRISDGEAFTDPVASEGAGDYKSHDEDADDLDDLDEEDLGGVFVATASQGLSQTFITLPSGALDAVKANYRRFGVELVDAGPLLAHMYALYERLP